MEKNMAPQQSISNPLEVRDQNVDLGSADTAPDRSARGEQSSAALSRTISPHWLSLSYRRYRPKLAISLSTAGALVLIGLVVAWVAPGLIDSSERRMLHRAAVHRDDSVVRTGLTAILQCIVGVEGMRPHGGVARLHMGRQRHGDGRGLSAVFAVVPLPLKMR